MSKWLQIQVNKNHIKAETASAVLISMPHNSIYDGYSFWHPSKCMRRVPRRPDLVTISFTDEWEFKLKKYGTGKHNKYEVVKEKEVTYDEIMEAFENENGCYEEPEEPLIHVPEKMEAVKVEAIEELIDD